MGNLLVEEKQIVFPGQELADGMDFLPSGQNVIRDGEKLVATRIGVVSLNNRLVKLIPLTGSYVPREKDIVIGKVTTTTMNGWRVDIGWHFEAFITLQEGTTEYIQRGADLTKYYDCGDYVVAQVTNANGARSIDLSMKGPGLRKLTPGRIIEVSSTKVPRIIGKKGSMVSLIKEKIGCRVSVGQNGKIWVYGENPEQEVKAIEIINYIVKNSHVSGLTDMVKKQLEKK